MRAFPAFMLGPCRYAYAYATCWLGAAGETADRTAEATFAMDDWAAAVGAARTVGAMDEMTALAHLTPPRFPFLQTDVLIRTAIV